MDITTSFGTHNIRGLLTLIVFKANCSSAGLFNGAKLTIITAFARAGTIMLGLSCSVHLASSPILYNQGVSSGRFIHARRIFGVIPLPTIRTFK